MVELDPSQIVVASKSTGGFDVAEEAYDAGQRIGIHPHARPHLVLVIEGSAREQGETGSRTIDSSSLTLFPETFSHEVAFEQRTRLLNIELREERLDTLEAIRDSVEGPWSVDSARSGALAREIRRELRSRSPVSDVALEGLVLQLIADGTRVAAGPGEEIPRIVVDAMSFIEERYCEKIGLRVVAGALGVSPGYLAASFRANRGSTVGQAIRSVRVERARRLMERESRSLGEIAIEVGFCDQPHFVRAFRSETGMTPSAYRQRVAEKNDL